MSKNEFGVKINPSHGKTISKALYKGDTLSLFLLLADYLNSNNLKVPESIVTMYQTQGMFENASNEKAAAVVGKKKTYKSANKA